MEEHFQHPNKQHWKAGGFEIQPVQRGVWTPFEAHAQEMKEISRHGGIDALENIKRPITPAKFEKYKELHFEYPANPYIK